MPNPDRLTARAVQRDETGAMLSLMCRCFNLEPEGARQIFYSDPFFDLSLKRVLIDTQTGALVSCLTVVPTTLRLDASTVLPIAGIAGVCTQPDQRGKGYARILIGETINALAYELGWPISSLTAERPQYYQNLGWEVCGSALDYFVSALQLPLYEEGATVRELSPAEMEERAPEIHRLYAQMRGAVEAGAFVRDERRWRCIEKLTAGRRIMVAERDGAIVSYGAYNLRNKDGVVTANMHEIIARDAQARRAIIGYLASGSAATRVAGTCSAGDAAALGLLGLPGVAMMARAAVFMRATHLTKLLSLLLRRAGALPELAKMPEGLTLRIDPAGAATDADIASGRFGAVVRSVGRRLQVTPDLGAVPESHWIAGDAGALTQLATGYSSATELVSSGRLKMSAIGGGVRPVCDQLFPRLNPYFAPSDVF